MKATLFSTHSSVSPLLSNGTQQQGTARVWWCSHRTEWPTACWACWAIACIAHTNHISYKRYAAAGYRTCLVVQSQDRVADRLLGMRLTPSPQPVPVPAAAAAAAADASQPPLLCALRVETTKLLLAPLEIIKKADERLGITQGALAEVVGEELSVLPGMDAVMAVAVLERIARPAGGLLAFATSSGPRATSAGKKGAAAGEWVYPWGEGEAEVVVFDGATTWEVLRMLASPEKASWDLSGSRAAAAVGEWVYPWGEGEAEVVVFDGATTWEVLRMLASPEKARWYLRRFRALAERTDIGRVALPSVARLLDSIVGSSKGGSGGSGGNAGGSGEDGQRSTAEIWEKLDSFLSVSSSLPSMARLLDSIAGSSKGGSGGSGGSGGVASDEQRSTAEIWEKLDSFLSVSTVISKQVGCGETVDSFLSVSADVETVDSFLSVSADVETVDSFLSVSADVETVDSFLSVSADVETVDSFLSVSADVETVDSFLSVSADVETVDSFLSVSADVETVDSFLSVSLGARHIRKLFEPYHNSNPQLVSLISPSAPLARPSSLLPPYLPLPTPQKAVSAFADPYRTSVFLLADAASHSSVDTCRRIWGCAVQAGVSPSGVFLLPSEVASGEGGLAEKFSPLPVGQLPVVTEEAPAAVAAAAGQMSDGAVAVMNGEGAGKAPPAVDVDVAACTVRLFLPGFDKQEVKLQQVSGVGSDNHQWKGGAELLVEAGDQWRCVELLRHSPGEVEGRGRAAGRGGGPKAVCGAASSRSREVLLATQRVEAGRFLPGVGSLPTNRLPPGLNSAIAAAAAAASSSSPAAALNSTLSGLQSSLNGQIASLDALLKKSLDQISAALNSDASADAALQAQISALKANLAALNASLVNLNALNISGSNLNFTDLISQISGLQSNISSISIGIAALNKDLAGIIGSGVGSGAGSRVGLAGVSSAATTAAYASRNAAIRAAVRQRLAAVTQRVAGLNGNVSALAGMLNALNSALNGALNGALRVANLLPQQAGMLRAVLTSCNGLLSLQAGAADIQILKIGSDYLLTYYLYAAGVTKAPDSQAIFKGNACGTAAASAALALPGTWVPMSPVSWSLANVVRASAADVADVLASIQGITNDDLFLGFSGADGALSGRVIGGKL
ncbi:unnamed protein product [Closterium sp. NIES-65]|nr:unnamed protein product [Closterium sp. NIES-65]